MRAPSLAGLLVSHWYAAWGVNVQAALYAGVYLWATRRVRGRWPLRRTLSFLAGIVSTLVALESGLDTFDDRLLSVHMLQHLVLLLLAPLLLLGGRPVILMLRALPPEGRPTLVRALARARERGLTGPLSCLVAFSSVVIVTHLPPFYEAALTMPALHAFEHALYLAAGLLFWWPVLDGDPVPGHRLGGLGRLVYLLASMPAMALVGAYLNRHASLVYPAYGPPGRALGISAVLDQQQAGAIMWVGGCMAIVVVGLWAVTAALLAEERRQRHRERRSDARLTDEPLGRIT